MKLLYNIGLFFFLLVSFPKLLRKKYRKSIRYRLGLKFPQFDIKPHQKVIWMHAVSVGETKALIPLIPHIKKTDPSAFLLISSGTETGHAEAKRSIPSASGHMFLPFDFPWLISKYLKQLHPDILILCEGELWLNLITQAYRSNCKIYLVNGKLSEKSFSRYRKLKSYCKLLLTPIEKFFVQDETHLKRYQALAVPSDKLVCSGNLKLDIEPTKLSPTQITDLKKELGIGVEDRVLTIGSTHEGEEELLLKALREIPNLKILLVPRHPQRFEKVEKLLGTLEIPNASYSNRKKITGQERVILIDAMGILLTCYQLSNLAIVGGSYIPEIGGHNIFEPTMFGKYVLFGPYMHGQKELVGQVIQHGVGEKIPLKELPTKLEPLLNSSGKSLQNRIEKMLMIVQGSALRTWNEITIESK